MRIRNMENSLAVAAALLALTGVLFAAGEALANGVESIDTTAVAIHTAGNQSIEIAEDAQVAAVRRAARTVTSDNRLELDIRLLDPISKTSANR